jgi:uncharacterized protein
MPSSQARLPTASASRYLQQVCKHWSHKFAVEFTSEKGHIPFSDGRICNLEATIDVITLRAEAPDAEALERLQRVVVEHVKRFASREELGEVQWTPTNWGPLVSWTDPLTAARAPPLWRRHRRRQAR